VGGGKSGSCERKVFLCNGVCQKVTLFVFSCFFLFFLTSIFFYPLTPFLEEGKNREGFRASKGCQGERGVRGKTEKQE
jgi:hypothetical protein